MEKYFNTTGPCIQEKHYMIDLESRLKAIKRMVDREQYFIINYARQYGKTTILKALNTYLKDDYFVISLDFQALSHADFENESSFIRVFARILLRSAFINCIVPADIEESLEKFSTGKIINANLNLLFNCISDWCSKSEKPIVLMIDEVDSASNNQVFIDFLAQIRMFYINKDYMATFYSVILAGVYNIKNIQQKIRTDKEHKINSPWNIAAPFKIDLNFDSFEIAVMLKEYEEAYHTGMNIEKIAQMLYEYTSGYPFLVSRLCQLLDEDITESEDWNKNTAWTKKGFLTAVNLLLLETNTLFDSLINKLYDDAKLKELLYYLLFCGRSIPYSPDVKEISIAVMFGFIKNVNGLAQISNRIFETRLYNMFLTSSEAQNTEIYNAALDDKNQFIKNGHLDIEYVLEKFIFHFHELYGDSLNTFIEEDGRRWKKIFSFIFTTYY